MTVGELKRAASHLYHTDYNNPLRLKIESIIDRHGMHPKTPVREEISEDIQAVIRTYKAIDKQIEDEKKKLAKWRKKRK